MMTENNANISLNETNQTENLDDSALMEEKDKVSSEKRKLSKDDRRQQTDKQKKHEEEKIKRETERKKKEIEKELERKKKELEKKEEQKKKEDDRKKKEEEKKMKQIERDEEKRKKEEEKRLKDAEKEEEKRKKEDDKKRREEEKRKEENEKGKANKKQRASILDFFLKKDKIDQEPLESSYDLKNVSFFKPIEVKKDMRMAKLERNKMPLINSILELRKGDLTYIDEIVNKLVCLHTQVDTWPISETDCEVVESSISRRIEAKSFLFTENVRPPYFGTWRKFSKSITPLNPLSEDISFFDYDIDSDQEWEYESGEDISNSEGEEEEEVNEDADDNSFLVPHGYLSDGEDCSDADADAEAPNINPSKRSMSPKSRQSIIEIREKQFQAEVKQKVQTINPNIIGPFYIDHEHNNHIRAIMEPYHMICQNPDGFPINCNLQSDFDHSLGSTKIKSVPIEAVPLLIRLLHHNALSRAKICYEFRMFWEYHLTNRLPDVTFDDDLKGKDWDEFTIGKKRLIDKIKEIAERKEGKWIVKPEVIHEYQLCCIDDDPLKACSEQWKYVSGVLKMDISKKQQKKTKPNDDQKISAKEPKQAKKRKQPTDVTPGVREKTIKGLNLNPRVQLIDNAMEKMTEIEAKEIRLIPMLDNACENLNKC